MSELVQGLIGPSAGMAAVTGRLVAALVLGWVVALVYRTTRDRDEVLPSFTTTLVLLSVLIAMVTQVIGDNVARAFSLVGALSIVRFRTVVRDTQDTAYVIFAVAVGMATGAGHLLLALAGIVVVSAGAVSSRQSKTAGTAHAPADWMLSIRLGVGYDAEATFGGVLDTFLASRRLVSIETVRQGTARELVYQAALRAEGSADALLEALNRLDGVQNIALTRAIPQELS